uniref:Uncharacterized protein n=1 Tax=Ascaris lumbricoides TaxID=6252 RepID=A0A9J2Q8X9_ASCLU
MGVTLAIVIAIIFAAIVFFYKVFILRLHILQNKLNIGSSGVEANASKQAAVETKPAGEMGVTLAIVIAIIFAAIVFFYKVFILRLHILQNKLNIGSSGVEANASKQATVETKPAGEQQADAAKPEAIVGADAVHAPLDASAPPPAEAAAPPSASLGGAPPAEGEADKKAADQGALSNALPEPDVNTAQKPTIEEMNKYANATADDSNKPESDVETAKDPTKEELEIALKKKVEGGNDIVELAGDATLKERLQLSTANVLPLEMAEKWRIPLRLLPKYKYVSARRPTDRRYNITN